ncbi:hypothetical protein CJU94_20165 [Paraburkholderia aromaticivorans]|uniref:Uncharacterized protein n=1 Tax=Paraburkholderia aromaticivorans TaxID=2026199 RepID=A0A248VNY8_9BURK|nr:hypothetical protein CJU94_20165 [Paraburkholderia aromaticivorans]
MTGRVCRVLLSGANVRRLFLTTMLAGIGGLQGCSTTLETLGLGVGLGIGVGAIGAVGTIACAIGCERDRGF